MSMQREKLYMNLVKLIVILGMEFLIGVIFFYLGLTEIHIFTIYIVGTLITALLTECIPCTILSVAGFLAFNFFFADPIGSFRALNMGYPVTFLVILVSAAIVGWMARRNAKQLEIITGKTERTQIIIDTSKQLIAAKSKQEIIEITAERMLGMTGMSVAIFIKEGDGFLKPQIFLARGKEKLSFEIDEEELKAVNMVFNAKSRPEIDTRLLERCNGFYLKIGTTERSYGVICLDIDGQRLEYKRTSLALGECALAFERDYYDQIRHQAAMEAREQKFRTELLRSISHDIRTPLTAISGNAVLLMNSVEQMPSEKVTEIGQSIWEDSCWLIRQAENILSITKLDEMKKNIAIKPELLEDILMFSVESARRYHAKHHYNLVLSEQFHVVLCNAQLIQQVLRNLFDNAAIHTKEGTTVEVRIIEQEEDIIVEVEDNGEGIEEKDIGHLFDMLFTIAEQADMQRGFGIGLALCKTIIKIHGGKISVRNAVPHGAIFAFSLKKAR